MRTILIIALIALTTSQIDLEAAKPLPVVKCLIASEIIRKDVVVVVDAVKQFIEDKNAFLLITKLLGVYPEVEAEVKRCLKEEGVNLKSFISKLPASLKKAWDSLPSSTKTQIMEAVSKRGRDAGKQVCYKLITQEYKKKICSYI